MEGGNERKKMDEKKMRFFICQKNQTLKFHGVNENLVKGDNLLWRG